MDPAVTWEAKAAGRGSHNIIPFIQWKCVLFLPNGPLDRELLAICWLPLQGWEPVPALLWGDGRYCSPDTQPGPSVARVPLQQLQGYRPLFMQPLQLLQFSRLFFPSSMYELSNISRMESCCKLKATNISLWFWQSRNFSFPTNICSCTFFPPTTEVSSYFYTLWISMNWSFPVENTIAVALLDQILAQTAQVIAKYTSIPIR